MTIRNDTIKTILTKTTTKMTGRLTQISIEKTMNELAKIEASIKTMHTAFPEGTKLGYAVAIMTAAEYRKQFTLLVTIWTFTKSTNPSTYDSSIKTSTEDKKITEGDVVETTKR